MIDQQSVLIHVIRDRAVWIYDSAEVRRSIPNTEMAVLSSVSHAPQGSLTANFDKPPVCKHFLIYFCIIFPINVPLKRDPPLSSPEVA